MTDTYEKHFSDCGFDGVFLDRIRSQSFETGISGVLSCACERCRKAFSEKGVNIDWVTVSPKSPMKEELIGRQPDEIKVIFDGKTDPEDFLPSPQGGIRGGLFLQPCDVGDPLKNKAIVEACVEYIKLHPQ